MDRVAYCAMEISAVFLGLTLITGSIWGRPTWGVWWAWDARLTSTAILFVFALGYLALRRANDDPELRASAVRSLRSSRRSTYRSTTSRWTGGTRCTKGATVFTENGNFLVHGSMLWTLFFSLFAFTLLFFWLLRARYRLEVRRDAALRDLARRSARAASS